MLQVKGHAEATYIYLSPGKKVLNPNTKDIFNYTVLERCHAVIKYKLLLYDDYSDEVGTLRAEATLRSPQPLTMSDLNKFVNELSAWGRELLNREADKQSIKLYIARRETIILQGNLDAA